MSDKALKKLNNPFSDKAEKAVLVLGFFDAVHTGHKSVISGANALAKELGAKTVVVSFNGNLKEKLSGEKCVYETVERKRLIKKAGADEVCLTPISNAFLSLSPKEYLDILNDSFNVSGYVMGKDYRFGKNAEGNADYVKSYAENRGQKAIVVSDTVYNGERVSAKRIKRLLATGNVAEANEMLLEPYSVKGKVFEDRKIGTKIGFPTVNVVIKKSLQTLKDGVYAGHITLGGKEYKTMINYGARPTFDLTEKLCEAHIIGFNGLLYGKTVKIYFDYFLREIKQFRSVEELVTQLKTDLEIIQEKK